MIDYDALADRLIDKGYDSIAWSEGGPWGDLQMGAHRAAICVVSAVLGHLGDNDLIIVSAADVDQAINGDDRSRVIEAQDRITEVLERLRLARERELTGEAACEPDGKLT